MKLTKNKAIKKAREEVSALYRFDDGYKFDVYDESLKAWRESQSLPYFQARIHRSSTLIYKAMEILRNKDVAYYAQYDYETTFHPGDWTDYVK